MYISQPIAKPPDEQKEKQLWAVSEQNTLKIFNAFLCVAWLTYILKCRLSLVHLKSWSYKSSLRCGSQVLGDVLTSSVTQHDRRVVGGAWEYHRLQENWGWSLSLILFFFKRVKEKTLNWILPETMNMITDILLPLSLKNSLVVFVHVRALILPTGVIGQVLFTQEKMYLVISSQVWITFITNMLARMEPWLIHSLFSTGWSLPISSIRPQNSLLGVPVNYSCLNVWTFVSKKFNFKMFECWIYVFELQ